MQGITDRYAYRAEAALAHFSDAHQMRHEPNGRERLICGLNARAGRGALMALCAAQGLPADESTLNLLAPVDCLDHARRLFGRHIDKAVAHARLLSRVLILDQSDAGAGYVTRDLFDIDDVMRSEEAAKFFVDLCCRRLLRCTWEQALIRFHPFREAPMTHTTLWKRRGPIGPKRVRSAP
jgi:hypothetical protein